MTRTSRGSSILRKYVDKEGRQLKYMLQFTTKQTRTGHAYKN